MTFIIRGFNFDQCKSEGLREKYEVVFSELGKHLRV
jgi:hypothetical protein